MRARLGGDRSAAADPAILLWWRHADEAAHAPTADAIASLEAATAAGPGQDDSERQAEMTEGLRQLLAVAGQRELPVIATRHRVIGADVCHFIAPATKIDSGDEVGKLFLTAQRLIFVGGAVATVPWHRVRGLVREGRAVGVSVSGADGWQFRCNTYGDALLACHLAGRLRQPDRAERVD